MRWKLLFVLFVFGYMMPYAVYASNPQSVSVENAENQYSVLLYASYSEGLPAQKGDKFLMEYSDLDGMVHSIVVDASEAVKNPIEFELNEGHYTIINISYTGENVMVHEQGFCITKDFAAGDHTVNEIRLGIGRNGADTVYKEYRNSIYVQNGNIINGLLVQGNDDGLYNTDEFYENGNQNEMIQSDSVSDIDKENIISNGDEDKREEEQNINLYEQKEQTMWFSLMIRNIPVFVILATLIAVCVIRYAKEKHAKEDF